MTVPAIEAHELTPASVALRPGADDSPLGQWKVRAPRSRDQVAVVTLFSRAPLATAEVAPWLAA